MKCKLRTRQQKLEDYVLGHLSDRQMEKFEEHLDKCKDCRSELEFLLDLKMSLHRNKKFSFMSKNKKFVNLAIGEMNDKSAHSKSKHGNYN